MYATLKDSPEIETAYNRSSFVRASTALVGPLDFRQFFFRPRSSVTVPVSSVSLMQIVRDAHCTGTRERVVGGG